MVLAMKIHGSARAARRLRGGALLLAVLLVAGCGGSATPPGERLPQAYFDGIATQTVTSLRQAVAAAEPGSPAAAYATYLLASSRAASDGGHPVEQDPQTAERTSKGYRFCQGQRSEKTCFEYAGVTRAGGKVADFTVNGQPISDRLAVGSGAAVAFRGIDAHAGFVAAYETTASDNLLVAVRITSGPGPALGAVDASYRAGTGAQVPGGH